MIKTRPFDAELIRSINERLPFPPRNFDDPLYFSKRIIESQGQVIAAGLLRVTSEAIILVNPEVHKNLKAKALRELIRLAKQDCQQYGIDEIHAFLAGDESLCLERILKKHFNFQDATGIPLVLEV